jgi:hypothetical protein
MDDYDLIGINSEMPPVAFQWDLLTDNERLGASRELETFVNWLVGRYRLQRQIPPCWWHHGAYIEELSALFIAWRGVMEVPDRSNAWIVWHEELSRLLGRLREHWTTGCSPDHHNDSPTPARPKNPAGWEGVD